MTNELDNGERSGRRAVRVCDGSLGWPELDEEAGTGANRLGWPELSESETETGTEIETSEADDGR